MRVTTFTKGKMNYFGSFSQQRTWAPLAQGEVGGPQVPLLGHGDEIENTNWACRDYRTKDRK